MTAGYLNRAIVAAMPLVPKSLVWRFSQRYIAGTSLEDAFATVRELNSAHCSATIDVLGEDSTAEEQVRAAEALYVEALQAIETEPPRAANGE